MSNVEDADFEVIGEDALALMPETGVSVEDQKAYRERMLNKAKETTADEEISDFKYIHMNNRKGSFFEGEEEIGDEFMGVIVDDAFVNSYYEGGYDPDNRQPPSCFGIAKVNDEMVPHETVEEPFHENCANCPNNAFGSAENGKGKACKNNRRIAVVAVNDYFEDHSSSEIKALLESGDIVRLKNGEHTEVLKDPDEEVYLINISTTSLKNYRKYKQKLKSKIGFPIQNVVTKISLVENDKDWYEYNFEPVRVCVLQEEPIIDSLTDKARAGVMRPFNLSKEEVEEVNKPKKTARRKR